MTLRRTPDFRTSAITGVPFMTATTVPSVSLSTTSTSLVKRLAHGTTAQGYGTTSTSTLSPTSVPGSRTTSSTIYCLTGTTADGTTLTEHGSSSGDQVVAVNSSEWPARQGERWTVRSGPFTGQTFVVHDHGPKAHFDIWQGDRPDCQSQARQYGGTTITIERA